MEKMTRISFEGIAGKIDSGAGVPVAIEDGRMGLIAHWDDDGAQIEAYRGNDHECIRVPWINVVDTPVGLVVGLRGAIRDADTNPHVLPESPPSKAVPPSLSPVIRFIEVRVDHEELPLEVVGGEYRPPIITQMERVLSLGVGAELTGVDIDVVEINGQRFIRQR